MVASPHREGGQAQFIERPLPAGHGAGSLEAVRRWALDHLDEPLDVATLADRAAVSPRTFARRFVAETGTTPLKWLHAQRVLEARRLLEHTDLAVEQVACTRRVRLGPLAARALPARDRDDADRLPAHVSSAQPAPGRRRLSARISPSSP